MKRANIRKFGKKNPYLSIGNSRFIKTEGILGIFDADKATVSDLTKEFLQKSEKKGKIITTSTLLPKSFIVYDDGLEESVYFATFSPGVLEKRSEEQVEIQKDTN